MSDYAFVSIWELAAPIERVWDEIVRPETYPEWFPYVTAAEKIAEGDDSGVGSVTRSRWRTALPYGFSFETRTSRTQRPHLLELVATGDLDGTGRYELTEADSATTVRYCWTVRTTKPWMNVVAPLGRPAFAWNHAVLIRSGGEGLARRLNARLLRNESYSEDSSNPLLPVVQTLGVIALLATIVRRLRRLLGASTSSA